MNDKNQVAFHTGLYYGHALGILVIALVLFAVKVKADRRTAIALERIATAAEATSHGPKALRTR